MPEPVTHLIVASFGVLWLVLVATLIKVAVDIWRDR